MFLVGAVLMAFNLTDDEFSYKEAPWFDRHNDGRTMRLHWGKKIFLDSTILIVALIAILIKLSMLGIFF